MNFINTLLIIGCLYMAINYAVFDNQPPKSTTIISFMFNALLMALVCGLIK